MGKTPAAEGSWITILKTETDRAGRSRCVVEWGFLAIANRKGTSTNGLVNGASPTHLEKLHILEGMLHQATKWKLLQECNGRCQAEYKEECCLETWERRDLSSSNSWGKILRHSPTTPVVVEESESGRHVSNNC